MKTGQYGCRRVWGWGWNWTARRWGSTRSCIRSWGGILMIRIRCGRGGARRCRMGGGRMKMMGGNQYFSTKIRRARRTTKNIFDTEVHREIHRVAPRNIRERIAFFGFGVEL